MTNGPLAGVKVLEFAGIGPAPFGCMAMAELGADVLRLVRPGNLADPITGGALNRYRPAAEADLRDPAVLDAVRELAAGADVLVEGFRPGVMERLGLGPDACLEANPGLVYARMTGWGQTGPLATEAGHDINFTSMSGVLASCAREGQAPVTPVNFVADFGGGGMLLLTGVLAALLERGRTGTGRVIDVAMTEGAAYLTAMLHGMRAIGTWGDTPGTNLIDTGRPFYDVYATADGRWVAVGALEPQFFAALVKLLGLDGEDLVQHDPAGWPRMRALFTTAFAARTRDEWERAAAGTDACVTPVLGLAEAAEHPHARARGSFTDGPFPRFPFAEGEPGPDGDPGEALDRWGVARAPFGV
jgi:alpha-methylacyl-CoA racemase